MTPDNFKTHTVALISSLQQEVGVIRANRPNAALLQNIKVRYYNELLPLQQVASISVLPPREITVSVWDKEAVLGVVKAIEEARLGVSVQNEGNMVRLRLPELSEERRKELAKQVKRIAEDNRIKVRHLRDEAMKEIEKRFQSHEFGEDQKFAEKDRVQKEVDRVNVEIETIVERKITDIMA